MTSLLKAQESGSRRQPSWGTRQCPKQQNQLHLEYYLGSFRSSKKVLQSYSSWESTQMTCRSIFIRLDRIILTWPSLFRRAFMMISLCYMGSVSETRLEDTESHPKRLQERVLAFYSLQRLTRQCLLRWVQLGKIFSKRNSNTKPFTIRMVIYWNRCPELLSNLHPWRHPETIEQSSGQLNKTSEC